MNIDDQIIDAFDMQTIRALCPLTKGNVPLIIVYRDTKDYPGVFTARLFNKTEPTYLIAQAETLEELLKAKPPEMVRIGRLKTDPPRAVETWL